MRRTRAAAKWLAELDSDEGDSRWADRPGRADKAKISHDVGSLQWIRHKQRVDRIIVNPVPIAEIFCRLNRSQLAVAVERNAIRRRDIALSGHALAVQQR